MAVATTIANQLQMARPDAVDKLEASKATWRKHWPKDLKSGQPSLSQLTLMGDWFLCLYFCRFRRDTDHFGPEYSTLRRNLELGQMDQNA
jgi:hypothetical protein